MNTPNAQCVICKQPIVTEEYWTQRVNSLGRHNSFKRYRHFCDQCGLSYHKLPKE